MTKERYEIYQMMHHLLEGRMYGLHDITMVAPVLNYLAQHCSEFEAANPPARNDESEIL